MIKTNAQKLIETKKEPIEGKEKEKSHEHYDIRKFHVVNIDFGMTEKELSDFCGYDLDCFDDPEGAYFSKGITIDYSDEIFCIDISKFLEYLDIVANKKIEEGEEPTDDMKKIKKALDPYKGYTLYFN